ncbi:MAG TPA: hypothetical protein VG099_27475, partial [Gemmataceae bacterium]|nr:hypothetical protein [Gemmataceae bacterium]
AHEGLIDPWLKTLSFWNGAQPLAAMHYYATHPMSYYGKGHISSDFCGLARQKQQGDHPAVLQIYFTGCAGNIAAGKYNTGTPETRSLLRERMHEAMKAAWQATERHPLERCEWRVEPVRLQPRREASFGMDVSRKQLENPKESRARRGNAAFQLAWLKRLDRPIHLSCLDLDKALVLHLPGEPFIEYQLKAQAQRKEAFVCVAGYGDDGPGYIPTAKAYFEGGYETTVALASPESEEILSRTIARLLRPTR